MSDIDNLLDATLDDLADLPVHTPFSPGVHRVAATMELKEINGNNCVILDFKGFESLELANPEDTPIKEGDLSGTMFQLGNEFGEGKLKPIAKTFAEVLNTSTLRETIEQVTDIECVIVTSIRIDKRDPDDIKYYLNVKDLNVV